MDKNLDRKIYMEDQLKNIDVNFHRIKGLNGHNIENGKIDGVNFKNNFNLSNSNMGCTLSHLKAVKTAYDYNLDIAIICEDDVNFITCSLNPDIKYIISNAPKDWEIIQLITNPYTQKNNNTDKYVKRHLQSYYSTACYIINKAGMKKIIDYSYIDKDQTFVLNKTKLTPSGAADNYIYDIVNTYSYFPNVFSVNNTKLDSTIHTSHSASHIKNGSNYLNTFSKQIKFGKTLIDMNDILQKNGQRFLLSFGTLLGVIREGKFIEHDNDIDIGVFIDDYNQEVEEEILKKFKLKHRLGSLETGYEVSFTHSETNVNIDIFVYYTEKDFIWSPSFFGLCDNAKNKMCRWKFSPFNLKKIEFLNRMFNIPDNPELYLTESYGKDWKIPKKFNYTQGLNGEYKNLIREDFL
jgi:GR25 family glycosyltransferase involved in LPS biosynthesis